MSKKKKPYKYLELYNDWKERGFCPYLCNYFGTENELFNMIKPSSEEIVRDAADGWGLSAWGSHNEDLEWSGYGTSFNSFRQTIILLMAAMNGEL